MIQQREKGKKTREIGWVTTCPTFHSFFRFLIYLHCFTWFAHCEKLCKGICFIFTLQQFGWDKMVLHNYTHVNGFLHINIL
jgi:hypothetical protein